MIKKSKWGAVVRVYPGADADNACMAAVELPASLPLAATVADALYLHEVLQTRFKIEVRGPVSRQMSICRIL